MKSSSKSSIIRWWLFVVILMDNIITDCVEACGAFFCQPQQPILQAGESIAFGVEQNGDYVNVTMVVQINYQGPAEDFAWLLPVPVVPELGVGSDLLFSALFQATQPIFSFSIDESLITTCGSRGPKTDEKCGGGGGLRSENDAVATTQTNADPPDDGVDIQARGAVGPFDFVTLQLSDGEDDPGVIFDWLEENGYDQPDESDTLISYYASMGMTFVALRLRKDNDDGDIRPLILKYSIEGSLDSTSVACVPIQLTAIAATPRMPIQVYTLGPSRGVPFNFFNVKLDFRFIDWIGCQFRFDRIPCYYNSYLSLFQAAIRDVKGHAFVTEYAGPVEPIVSDIIPGRLSDEDITTLSNQADPDSFLQTLTTFLGFGTSFAVDDLINSVLEEHIRHRDCPDLPVYPPGRTCGGLESVNQTDINFAEMARQLDQVVFEPAREAQVWLNSYPYLSRLYAQLDPSQMTKDPFFAFTEDLPGVSRNHSAVGVPVCDEDRHGRAIEIRIDDESTTTTISTHVDAEYTCSGFWRSKASSDLLCTASTTSSSNPPPALELASLSFTGEQSRIIQANAEGIYLESEIEELVLIMDSRVPEQLGLSIGNNQMSSDGDSGELLPECIGVYHDGSFSGTKISLETTYYCIFILLGVSVVLIRA